MAVLDVNPSVAFSFAYGDTWLPMNVDPQAQMLGALIRTFLTLAALVGVLRYMIAPIVVEWYQLRRQQRVAQLRRHLDDTPPDAHTTRHGAS